MRRFYGSLFIVAGFLISCQSLTRDDGSTVKVLTPAATQSIGAVADTAKIISLTTPAPVSTTAMIVAGIATLVLGVDKFRRQPNQIASTEALTKSVSELMQALVEAGWIREKKVIVSPSEKISESDGK